MKLTRRRISQERKNQKLTAAFYRDMDHGLLYVDSEDEDRTEYVVSSMDFERSWRGRILKNGEDNKNPFYEFVKGLVGSNEIICKPITNDNNTDINEKIKKYITEFGRNLKAPGSEVTLEKLILNIQSGTSENEVRPELEKIKDMIKKDIEKRKDELIKSITNNHIPFMLDEDKLVPSTKKMKWLYKFLNGPDKSLNLQMFDEYWIKYGYKNLEEKIIKEINSLPEKNARSISRAVSKTVREYNRNFRINYMVPENENAEADSDYEGFLLFLKAVEQHFKKYYPVKSKDSNEVRDKNLCEEKNYKFYCSYNFVKNEVKRSIINQLVSGLIQQGKLLHYFYKDGIWQQDFLNSYGLSYIQVEESFKKSLMTSLSWGINRLTSFFIDVGTDENEEKTVQNKKQKNNRKIDDILSDKSNLRAIFNDLRSNTELQKHFKEKLAFCYPIFIKVKKEKMFDDIEKLIKLVEEARESVAYLRHRCFHYKDVTITEMLKALNNNTETDKTEDIDYSVAAEYFLRDINNLYDAFREQIRSSGIADYYPADIISGCFKKCGLQFVLYSPQNSLMPSFKNIYKRGSNLYKAYQEEKEQKDKEYKRHNTNIVQEESKELSWYIEVSDTEQGKTAYRNLLQLIYYHAFLPEVRENESLITVYFAKTKEWNRKVAETKAKKKNAGKTYKDKPIRAYRYEAIPDYVGERLDDYFKILQREQMAKAKDVNEGNAENNNYIQFIRDVVVWAFGAYLEERLEKYKKDLQSSHSQKDKKDVNDALKELFPDDKDKRQFFMKCKFTDVLINDVGENNQITEMEDLETSKEQQNREIIKRKDLLCFYLFLRLLDEREISGLKHQFVRYRCSLKERRLPDNRKDVDEEIVLLEELEELMELVSYTMPSVPELSGKAESGLDLVISKYFKDFFEKSALKNQDIMKLYYQSDNKTPVFRKYMALLMRSAPLQLYKDMFRNYYIITEKECQEYIKTSQDIDAFQCKLNELHKELEHVRLKTVEDKKGKIFYYLAGSDAERVKEYEDTLSKVVRYKRLQHKLTFESLYTIFKIHVDIAARMVGYTEDWERDMLFLFKSLEYNEKLNEGVVEKIFNNKDEKGHIVKKLKDNLNSEDKEKIGILCWHKEITDKNFVEIIWIRNPIAHLNHFMQTVKNPKRSLEKMINALCVLLSYDRKRQNSVTKTINDLLLNEYHVKIKWKRWVDKNCNIYYYIDEQNIENEPILHIKHLHMGEKCHVNRNADMFDRQKEWLRNGITEEVYDKSMLGCICRLFKFDYNDLYGANRQ